MVLKKLWCLNGVIVDAVIVSDMQMQRRCPQSSDLRGNDNETCTLQRGMCLNKRKVPQMHVKKTTKSLKVSGRTLSDVNYVHIYVYIYTHEYYIVVCIYRHTRRQYYIILYLNLLKVTIMFYFIWYIYIYRNYLSKIATLPLSEHAIPGLWLAHCVGLNVKWQFFYWFGTPRKRPPST